MFRNHPANGFYCPSDTNPTSRKNLQFLKGTADVLNILLVGQLVPDSSQIMSKGTKILIRWSESYSNLNVGSGQYHQRRVSGSCMAYSCKLVGRSYGNIDALRPIADHCSLACRRLYEASGLSKWTDLMEREVDVGYTSQGGLSTIRRLETKYMDRVEGHGCELEPTAARCYPTVAIMQHHENCFAWTQFRNVGSRLFVRDFKAQALSNRICGMPFDFHAFQSSAPLVTASMTATNRRQNRPMPARNTVAIRFQIHFSLMRNATALENEDTQPRKVCVYFSIASNEVHRCHFGVRLHNRKFCKPRTHNRIASYPPGVTVQEQAEMVDQSVPSKRACPKASPSSVA